ncbi:MAG: ATP-binding cassette domain-containing protein, partial [Gemmatimonadaceae bacterium]
MIRFTNVSKDYARGTRALQDVTLHIGRREFVFLTGPSGAGKSTLLKMIYLDERP